ncbi:MAG: PAS domain S-box protein [Proteobacteria bacterium]|nr:PAS domain S-box protein [Pseudomonadota bacterium]
MKRNGAESNQIDKLRKQADEELKRVFDISPDLVGTGNLDGYFTRINSSFKKILGYEEEELLAKPFIEFIHKEDVETTLAALGKAVEGTPEIYVQNRYKCKDGSYIWIEWKVITLAEEGVFYAAGRSLTERKQAEEMLKQAHATLQQRVEERTRELKTSEEQLRHYERIVSFSTDMMALLDNRFIYLAANPAYLGAFNLPADKVIGHTIAEVFGEKFFHETIMPHAERCLAGEKINYQAWFDFPGHESAYMDINYYPYIREDNQIIGFVVNARDITERIQLEKHRDLIIHDMGERVKELATMYGLSESIRTRENLGEVFQDIADLIPLGWHYSEITRGKVVFDQREYVSEPFKETGWKQSSDIVVNGEHRGSIEVYFLEECPDLDEGPFMKEERDLIDGMARSISEGIERKMAAKALDDAKVELEQYAAQLERSNMELDEFAYIASHDLKEPLRGIRTYSGFLIEDYGGMLDSEGKNKLDTLVRLTTRMETLLDDLLYFSRVGRVELAFIETDLATLVTEIIDSMHITLAEQGVQVMVAADLPNVICDRIRVGEVFRNLISNGAKYNTEDDKQIEVGWHAPSNGNNEPVFFVRDNGIGIREKHMDRIFKIFKRLHGRDKFGGGSGSGLTITQKIIERHGGRIWLESEFGKGSTFFFTLKG